MVIFGTNLAFKQDPTLISTVLEAIADMLSTIHSLQGSTNEREFNDSASALNDTEATLVDIANFIYLDFLRREGDKHTIFTACWTEVSMQSLYIYATWNNKLGILLQDNVPQLPWYSWGRLKLPDVIQFDAYANCKLAADLYNNVIYFFITFACFGY